MSADERRLEITRLLGQFADGVDGAQDRLFPLIYEELHILARRELPKGRSAQTLTPTDLVHEAYSRLVDQKYREVQDRSHFYRIAAEVIRRVLVDHARARRAQKRGGGKERLSLTLVDPHDKTARTYDFDDVLDLETALCELTEKSPIRARIFELRFFSGLSVEETASVLNIHGITVKRHSQFVRAWLYERMQRGKAI